MINKTSIITFALLLVAFQLQGMDNDLIDTIKFVAHNDEETKELRNDLKGICKKYSTANEKIKHIIKNSQKKSRENTFIISKSKKKVKTNNSFFNFLFDIRNEEIDLIAFYPSPDFLGYLNHLFFIPGKSRYIDKDCYFPYNNETDADKIYETNDKDLTYDFYSKTQRRIWDAMRICFTSAAVLYSGQKLINLFFKG